MGALRVEFPPSQYRQSTLIAERETKANRVQLKKNLPKNSSERQNRNAASLKKDSYTIRATLAAVTTQREE